MSKVLLILSDCASGYFFLIVASFSSQAQKPSLIPFCNTRMIIKVDVSLTSSLYISIPRTSAHHNPTSIETNTLDQFSWLITYLRMGLALPDAWAVVTGPNSNTLQPSRRHNVTCKQASSRPQLSSLHRSDWPRLLIICPPTV